MTEQAVGYQIWVNWDHCVVSFHPENGFDLVYFHSEDNYHANIRILVQSGFRFQRSRRPPSDQTPHTNQTGCKMQPVFLVTAVFLPIPFPGIR